MRGFFLILIFTTLCFGQERRLLFGGIFTGSPENYMGKLEVISGRLLEKTCVCPVGTGKDIGKCVDGCLKGFERKVRSVMKKSCGRSPGAGKIVLYGAGDVKLSHHKGRAYLKRRRLRAEYDVSIVTVYGTGFCAILKSNE